MESCNTLTDSFTDIRKGASLMEFSKKKNKIRCPQSRVFNIQINTLYWSHDTTQEVDSYALLKIVPVIFKNTKYTLQSCITADSETKKTPNHCMETIP